MGRWRCGGFGNEQFASRAGYPTSAILASLRATGTKGDEIAGVTG
jgi:hypothetical protein